ncbi:MAG: hypothetical protein H6819_12185 [Phycisphaerales bacterium]|nr:hypothetical protein [Phycisphaerales bacterium]MCB9858707.1 hypothetical protein [Phycisphaerales bacterium]MCB9864437.1 hypothetical protein [Phycisphaerales bacterium]
MTARSYRRFVPRALMMGAALFMGMAAECPMNNNMNGNTNDNSGNTNGNDNTGGTPGANFTPVNTGIDVHNSARVAAGDGIIAYGTGGFSGVDWIMKGDTTGRGITNSADYRASSFAVIGKKIILVKSADFTLNVFDTEANTYSPIDVTDIRLQNIPVGVQSAGHIRADGNYVGTMSDDGEVTDGKIVKVVDVSGATPTIIAFDSNPPSQPDQLDVDAANEEVAVADNDIFYVYDINNPATAPEMFDMTSEGGIEDTQIQFKAGYILFHAFENGSTRAKVLNTDDGTVTDMDPSESAVNLCLNATMKYIYFVDRDANDSIGADYRSGVGTLPTVAATLAGDTQVANGTDNLGRFGWTTACTIPPDGSFLFLCTSGSIGTSGYLQVGTGGDFVLLTDPDDSTDNLRASDAHASNDIVAYKTGRNADTTLGYIDLP